MICNVALIPGNAAYLEYMRNATMGHRAHDDDTIAFPTYGRQGTMLNPLEAMIKDVLKAVGTEIEQLLEWYFSASTKISLPLAFEDQDYADRFEHEFMRYFLERRITLHAYDLGSDATFAARGGICLIPPANPLILAVTPAQQPLRRFAASAELALSRIDTIKAYPSQYKVRFACNDYNSYASSSGTLGEESSAKGWAIDVTSEVKHP